MKEPPTKRPKDSTARSTPAMASAKQELPLRLRARFRALRSYPVRSARPSTDRQRSSALRRLKFPPARAARRRASQRAKPVSVLAGSCVFSAADWLAHRWRRAAQRAERLHSLRRSVQHGDASSTTRVVAAWTAPRYAPVSSLAQPVRPTQRVRELAAGRGKRHSRARRATRNRPRPPPRSPARRPAARC